MEPTTIALVGDSGIGKSTLLPTLPYYGKEPWNKIDKYILSFVIDPQGEQAYAWGKDRVKVVKILNNAPTIPNIVNKANFKQRPLGFDRYTKFAKFVQNLITTGEIKKYKWIVIDSFTWFAEMILMEIADKEGRLGQTYYLEDYGRAANTIKTTMDSFLCSGLPIVMTAHCRYVPSAYDKAGNVTAQKKTIMTYGKLAEHIPGMFENIFDIEVEMYGSEPKHVMKLVRDGLDNYTRTTLTNLEANTVNVDVDISKPPEEQGLSSVFLNFTPSGVEGMDIVEL